VLWVMWNLVSICFEIVLASVQDWCSVCVKRTIGSLMVLDAPVGDEGLVELYSVRLKIVLLMTQDRCTVCTECTIGS
jgi:hypothetical protein